jgi:hypothetical protein
MLSFEHFGICSWCGGVDGPKYKNPTLHVEQGGAGESMLDASGRMVELGGYCHVMLVSSETRNGTSSTRLA